MPLAARSVEAGRLELRRIQLIRAGGAAVTVDSILCTTNQIHPTLDPQLFALHHLRLEPTWQRLGRRALKAKAWAKMASHRRTPLVPGKLDPRGQGA